jgi:hypothetical protein
MASGDVDGDGDTDLAVRGEWVENPGSTFARDPARSQPDHIGEVGATFKAPVTDLDQDGQADVLFSSSEQTDDVVRFTRASGDPRGSWRRQVILHQVERAHTL